MKGGIIVDWNVIKAEYIAGGTTYEELAEKYGASLSTLKKKAAREHWAELRNQTGTETELKMSEAISDQQSEAAVTAVQLINESALNMLRQISRDTAETMNNPNISLTDNRFAIYARALKQLKEVLDIRSENDHADTEINVFMGGEGKDYSV